MTGKTSVSDPIRLPLLPATAVPPPGRIGLTFAPGKHDPGRWDRDLAADVAALRDRHGAHVVVSLIEQHELGLLAIPTLFEAVKAAGLRSIWFPIRDVSVPTSMPGMLGLVGEIVAEVRAGRTVVVHCRGGLGRAGLVSASCVVALGTANAVEAVAIVRAARPGAIETPEQAAYVTRFAAAWAARAA